MEALNGCTSTVNAPRCTSRDPTSQGSRVPVKAAPQRSSIHRAQTDLGQWPPLPLLPPAMRCDALRCVAMLCDVWILCHGMKGSTKRARRDRRIAFHYDFNVMTFKILRALKVKLRSNCVSTKCFQYVYLYGAKIIREVASNFCQDCLVTIHESGQERTKPWKEDVALVCSCLSMFSYCFCRALLLFLVGCPIRKTQPIRLSILKASGGYPSHDSLSFLTVLPTYQPKLNSLRIVWLPHDQTMSSKSPRECRLTPDWPTNSSHPTLRSKLSISHGFRNDAKHRMQNLLLQASYGVEICK